MSEAAPKDEHFDLFHRDGEMGIFWRFENHGITLTPDRMTFPVGKVPYEGRFADIRTIQLHLVMAGKESIGSCQLRFNNGFVLNVISGNQGAAPDAERAGTYVNFVAELHHRLSRDDKNRIRFIAGLSETRHMLMMIATFITAGFSILLPLGLFFSTGKWEALLIMLGGFGLAYPLWKNAEANRPREYNPDALPPELVP
jgi:hypothetical protein